MPKSAAFANLENAVLQMVMDIPAGQVVELPRLAEALNVPARHVAHILSRQRARLGDQLPFHRVVPAAGNFPTPAKCTPAQLRQLALLASEGHTFTGDRLLKITDDRRHVLGEEYRQTIWAEISRSERG